MTFAATTANDLVRLVFQAVNIGSLADNASAAPLTNLFLSLHTADPSGGNQSTSETSYTGYARLAVIRTAGGFACTGRIVTLVAQAIFGTSTVGTPTITHAGVGYASSGATKLITSEALVTPRVITVGDAPRIQISDFSFTLN